jgi:apolipoprotein N-acyltransferase
MLAASFPPLHPLVLPFVALVPLACWVGVLPPDAAGSRAASRGGLVFGVVAHGLLCHWILTALLRFSWWAVPAFLGALLLLAAWSAVSVWALHRVVHRAGAPVWVALPVVWAAWEWGRGHWPGSLAFPWLGLGSSLTGFPELAGVAELVGATGVGFWVAAVNGMVAAALLSRGGRGGRTWRRLAVGAVMAALLPAAWGVWRASTLEMRPAARVAVVQPNVSQRLKLEPAAALDSALDSFHRLLPRVEPGSVDLVVLPEMAFPVHARRPSAAGVVGQVQGWAREAGAPILFGAVGEAAGHGGTARFNSAFLVRPGGLTPFQYDKRHLVPGVERMPFARGLPGGGGGRWGGYGVGEGWPLAEVDEARAGVLICFESAFPGLARRLRLEGADVLVNITNDAWFGGEAVWSRSAALWQHPAHLVMRAIETRAGVVRSANTGISLFVDPVGRVSGATPLFRPAVRTAVVTTSDVTTFHTRHGDLVGPGSAMAVLLLLLAAGRGGVRRTLDRVGARH